MFSVTVLTFFLFGSGRCFDWDDAFPDVSWDDIKDPIQNAYNKVADKASDVYNDISLDDMTDKLDNAFNKVADKTSDIYNDISWDDMKNNIENAYNQASDSIQDFNFKKRKQNAGKRNSVTPDFNNVVETTLIRTNGIGINNELSFEVLSHFELDIVWSIMQKGVLIPSFGHDRRVEDMFISSFYLRVQDLADITALNCLIYLNHDFLFLQFKIFDSFSPTLQNLRSIIRTYRGPFSPYVSNNGTFEFDIKLSEIESHQQNEIAVRSGYFDTNQIPQRGILFDTVETEITTNETGITHITTRLMPYKSGEFILLVEHSKEAESFDVVVGHRVDIPRYEQIIGYGNVAFVRYFGEIGKQQFPEHIRHGALSCNAVGEPIPEIDIFKNNRRIPSVSIPFMGASTVGMVSFNGRNIDEVAGTYVCRARSGNHIIVREILVEQQ